MEEQYSKFYRANFQGNIKALSSFKPLIQEMVNAEGDYTEAQTESLLALEEKRKLMVEIGIFEDKLSISLFLSATILSKIFISLIQ